MKRLARLFAPTVMVLTALVGCTGDRASDKDQSAGSTGLPDEQIEPAWHVTEIAEGLDYPWDVAQTPDGAVLFTERGGKIGIVRDQTASAVTADLQDVYANGELGLMGLVIDPGFADNRRFYTCYASISGDDIRVVAWTMSEDFSSAVADPAPLVQGITRSQSRHGGCRLRFDGAGALVVGTGDATTGAAPQSLTSLAGKTLRVDPADGAPMPDNPFIENADPRTRLIDTYGHRNVQGLALQPTTGAMYSVEHGPDRDDEINLLASGADYGWNPVGQGGGYDESLPMTDPSLGSVTPAVWSSGYPTLATSGATFLDGAEWGELDGYLLVAALKGEQLLAVDIDADGDVHSIRSIAQFAGTYGRLRTVQLGIDGSFFVTTSNGGSDVILEVRPG